MGLTLRSGAPDDAKQCGTICYEAFKTIADEHRFPPDFPSPDVAVAGFANRLSHPGYHVIVAELGDRVVGSNVLDERSTIAGIGPITVDPTAQNRMIGRQLMESALQRVADRSTPGVRLVQSRIPSAVSIPVHQARVRDARTACQPTGPALVDCGSPGYAVRAATDADVVRCNALCRRVHGHDRRGELVDAVKEGTATVVEHEGRLTGYATVVGFFGHAVGESNADLQALIGAAGAFLGPGFLLPARNGDLFRWCLERGLRVVQPLTLMSLGLYNEPRGAFLPSIIY